MKKMLKNLYLCCAVLAAFAFAGCNPDPAVDPVTPDEPEEDTTLLDFYNSYFLNSVWKSKNMDDGYVYFTESSITYKYEGEIDETDSIDPKSFGYSLVGTSFETRLGDLDCYKMFINENPTVAGQFNMKKWELRYWIASQDRILLDGMGYFDRVDESEVISGSEVALENKSWTYTAENKNGSTTTFTLTFNSDGSVSWKKGRTASGSGTWTQNGTKVTVDFTSGSGIETVDTFVTKLDDSGNLVLTLSGSSSSTYNGSTSTSDSQSYGLQVLFGVYSTSITLSPAE